MRYALILASILQAACVGTIGDQVMVEEDVGHGPRVDTGTSDAGMTDPGVAVCGDYPHLLRRLTRRHYEQMLQRMFPGVELPPLDVPKLLTFDYDYDYDATRATQPPRLGSRAWRWRVVSSGWNAARTPRTALKKRRCA